MGHHWASRRSRVRNRRNDVLANLDPYEFERVVAEHYRREGYQVEHCGGRGRFDGGIDLKMRRDGEYIIVQCKRQNAYQVTHNVGHELLGVLLTEKADRAIVVNTGEFTPYALESAAKEPRLELVDGDRLREMLPEYARPVHEPGPVDDFDKHALSIPAGAQNRAREPMLAPRINDPGANLKRSRTLPLDRGGPERPSRSRRRRSDGARAFMALAMLAAILVWQCSRETPQSSASSSRGSSAASSSQSRPLTQQPAARPSAGTPSRTGRSRTEQGVNKSASTPRSPEESRRRADEAMRILAPTTPELEPLPGMRAMNGEEQ